MGRFDGKVVLITGGGSGLGRALVERFVAEGATVAVLERSPAKVEALVRAHGGAVLAVTGDVTSAADNRTFADAALSRFGRTDAFIGNAGLWDFSRPLADLELEDVSRAFDELFAVNVKGYMLGARACLAALRESRGCMIFTLSNASFFPGGGGVLYTASKHAGVGLVRQLAYELAPEVRVNGVAPGGMSTDLRGPGALGQEASPISAMPIQEYTRKYSALEVEIGPEDYVAPYLMLASPSDAKSVTGTVIDVSSVGIPQRR